VCGIRDVKLQLCSKCTLKYYCSAKCQAWFVFVSQYNGFIFYLFTYIKIVWFFFSIFVHIIYCLRLYLCRKGLEDPQARVQARGRGVVVGRGLGAYAKINSGLPVGPFYYYSAISRVKACYYYSAKCQVWLVFVSQYKLLSYFSFLLCFLHIIYCLLLLCMCRKRIGRPTGSCASPWPWRHRRTWPRRVRKNKQQTSSQSILAINWFVAFSRFLLPRIF
jgi:hypothetical protein